MIALLDVTQLCELYLERYAKPHKRSWAQDERILAKDVLPRPRDCHPTHPLTFTMESTSEVWEVVGVIASGRKITFRLKLEVFWRARKRDHIADVGNPGHQHQEALKP